MESRENKLEAKVPLTPALALVVALVLAVGSGCAAPQRPMIPAERIAREPVPSGYIDTTAVRGELSVECYLILNAAQDYRAVQLAGVGMTTLGIIGALVSRESELIQTASQVAVAAGTFTQLVAGSAAMVKDQQAYERGCR